MDRYPRSNGSIIQQAGTGLQTYMAQVYGWMTCGLLLTAFVAWYVSQNQNVVLYIFSNSILFYGLIIAQFGLVFVLSGMINRIGASLATGLFMLYS
ncbi:Bax inhibitor-1 family protein, partial [Enterobacter hormaechei]|nr:Bax inhibitor-1 family protein [Enterobacter hormaechei]